jgi:hypothetical protein
MVHAGVLIWCESTMGMILDCIYVFLNDDIYLDCYIVIRTWKLHCVLAAIDYWRLYVWCSWQWLPTTDPWQMCTVIVYVFVWPALATDHWPMTNVWTRCVCICVASTSHWPLTHDKCVNSLCMYVCGQH